MAVDTILYNAKIATNRVPGFVEAVAITAGTISATGTDEEILRLRGPMTTVIDGNRRHSVPCLAIIPPRDNCQPRKAIPDVRTRQLVDKAIDNG